MGFSTELSLLLLLSSCASAQERDESSRGTQDTCLRESFRFKNLWKYVYNYEAETLNGVPGTANSRSGVMLSCKVELDVARHCGLLMQVNQCSLREVHSINAEGKPIFRRSKESEDFQKAMSQYELKFSTLGHNSIILYPHRDESTNILNIKRGIISTLLVPMESSNDTETHFMDSIYGKCESHFTVNSRKESVAIDVSIDRDLTKCRMNYPTSVKLSPFALFGGEEYSPSSKLGSSQSCTYSLDARKKYVTEAICNEKHILLPSSHKNQYGLMSTIKQTLKLENSIRINNRYFIEDKSNMKSLMLELTESKTKNSDTALATLQELVKLAEKAHNQQRANLFQKFVVDLRSLEKVTLLNVLPKLIETSSSITQQALPQCGTLECAYAIIKLYEDEPMSTMSIDAITYAMGLMPSPCKHRLQQNFILAKHRQSRATFYGLSHTVRKFYEQQQTVGPELKAVADYMLSLIGNDCSGEEDKIYLTLKALGNMGKAMENANPRITSTLLKCVKNSKVSTSVQEAAIRAFRQMTLTEEARSVLLQVYLDVTSPLLKRLGAYFMVMKNPSTSDLRKITRNLPTEQNQELQSFVYSHMIHILQSEEPTAQELKNKLAEISKDPIWDVPGFSRNYETTKTLNLWAFEEPVISTMKGNLIFKPDGVLPRAVMLETTLNVLGQSIDLFELDIDGKGFEPSMDAIFGPDGFFPNSVMHTLYWVDGKIPDKVTEVLFNWFQINRDGKPPKNRLMEELVMNYLNTERKIRKNGVTPEANAFLRIFGNELGYVQFNDIKQLVNMLSRHSRYLQRIPFQIRQALIKGVTGDQFVHYMFLDSQFNFPTGAGLPLKFSLLGTIAPGAKAGIQVDRKQGEVFIKPSVGVEFVTQLGVNVPDFTRNAIQINFNLYHESGIEARISMNSGQVKLSIPAPTEPTKLLSVSTRLLLLYSTKTEEIPSIMESRQEWKSCKPLISGLNLCNSATYSESNDESPRYPLTGETRFVVELEPTGAVSEYSATLTYQSPREKDLEHSVQLVVKAEGGIEGTEATMTVTYNANTHVVTGDIQIPKFDVEFGVKTGIQDTSASEKTSYVLSFNVTNKNVLDLTLVGHVSSGVKDLMLRGLFSIPSLAVEANTKAYFQDMDKMYTVQLDAAAAVPYSKASHQVNIQLFSKKAQMSWNSEVTSDIQIIRDQIPELSTYQRNIQQHADQLLDRKVAQTDMTVKHIISQFMVAMNSWLKRASDNVPYAATLEKKLRSLQDLNFEQIGSFSIDLPEKLFLKSQGSAKCTLSRDKISFTVPIRFGGKLTEEIRLFPNSIRTPAVSALGLYIPANVFHLPINFIPPINIPEQHTFSIPSISKLEFFTQMDSNYYIWKGTFLGENMSKKGVTQITAKMDVNADSALDFLDYQLEGNALFSQNTNQITTVTLDGSFHHILLESSVHLSETVDTAAGQKAQSSFTWEASSNVGVKAALLSSFQLETKNSKRETQGYIRGMLDVSSYQFAWNYTVTSTIDTQNYEAVGHSVLDFNSPLLQASNKIDGEYTKGVFTINSNTACSHFKNLIIAKVTSEEVELKCDTSGQADNGNLISNIKWMVNKNGFKTENKLKGELFDANLQNVALLEYSNSLLSLSLDTTGRYKAMETTNKLDLTASTQHMNVRHECLASYSDKQFQNILTGTFNLRSMEVNADTKLSGGTNQAANKATLKIDSNGLTTGVISNIQISPLKVNHAFNAAVDGTQASLKMDTVGAINKHSVSLKAEGTAGSRGIVASTLYRGDILDTNSNNIVNFKLSKEEGLVFNTKTQASYGENKLEHKNELSIAGWSLKGKTKIESSLSSGSQTMHRFEVDMKPFTASFDVKNKLKYREFDVTHNGQLVLEPFKINLKGDMKGLHKRNRVTHTYSIGYADWVAALSTNTVGNIESATIRHKVDFETTGLSATFSSDSSCDSTSLQFTNGIHSAVVPFLFTLEANTNGNFGVLGSHSGDLINKFQMKAAPLSLILVHDFRGTSQLHLESGKPTTALLENKINIMLNPSEQTSTWGVKSQLNRNTYVQNINAYNNPETIGMDVTGQAMVDLGMFQHPVAVPFSSNKLYLLSAVGLTTADIAEPKELQVSASLQYDKSKDAHVINIPLLENLPIYFEQFKGIILNTLESIQNYLQNLDIDRFVENYKKTLEKFPGQVNNFIRKFNLEQKINDARENMLSFAEKYRITEEDLEVALKQAQVFYKDAITQLQTYLTELKDILREYDNYEVQKAIENLIHQLMETLRAIDQRYEISQTSIRTLTTIQDALQRFKLSELQGAAVAWVQHMNDKHQIQVQLLNTLQQLKLQIHSIDLEQAANRLKQQIASINVDEVVDKLKQLLNTEKINELIAKLKRVLLMLMEDYEIMDKINSINTKLQELIVKYEIGKSAQVLWDNTLQLIKKYKIKDTLQKVANILKGIDIKSYTDSLIQTIDGAIQQIKSYNYEEAIDKFNDLLSTIIAKLKEFDYNVFVDAANNRIREITRTVNDKIQELELPQKVEAVKEYIRALQLTVSEYLEILNQKKVSELIKQLSDLLISIGISLLEDMNTRFQELLEDLEDRFSRMNIQQELQWYWQQVVQSYQIISECLSDLYNISRQQINIWAEMYELKDLLDEVCRYLEEGFVVPEFKTSLFTMPQFEVSLRAIRRGEFNTPAFIVPLTDLQIPSFHVDLKNLNSINIPTRFTIPQFTILKLVTVPDITIDLEKVKEYIVSTINNLRHFDVSVENLNIFRDIPFPVIYLPEIKVSDLDFSALHIPDLRIPKLNLHSFHLNDMQIPDFQLPRIPHTLVLPAFGKLTGTFNISSPVYSLMAKAGIHNSTTSHKRPVALAFLTAKAKSTAEILSFNFDATARLTAPQLQFLELRENVKLDHITVRIDHEGTLTFTTPSINGRTATTIKIVSEAYNAEAKNVFSSMIAQQGLSTNMETTYNHNFNVPQAQISSQVTMVNIVKGSAHQTSATLSVTNTGSGRWSVKDFSDEGTHQSELKLNLRGSVAVATFSGDTSTKYIKMKQTFTSEVSSLFYTKFALNAETDITEFGRSLVNVSGKGELGDLKMEVTASHDANLSGRAVGTVSNLVTFTAQPFAIHTSTKNKAILKVSFPLTLIAKIDLTNNYELTLTSNKQLCTWQVSTKFNQYKYHHKLSVGNDEESITAQLGLNGDANLDFLTSPISIPTVTLPYSSVKTPEITGYSLWEQAGLKSLLKTPHQSFDLSMKAQYKKNKDMHTCKVELGPLYRMINNWIKTSVQSFEDSRDKVLNVMEASYNDAKANYDASRVDSSGSKLPKSLHIPGYTIPLLNIDVSSCTVELPALGFVTPRKITTPTFTLPVILFSVPSYRLVVPSPDLPVLQIPSSLYRLSLPKIKMPRIQDSIKIPAMGNLTYDFSFKSSVITLSASAGLFNQSDIVARYSASSSSVFTSDFKAEGTTSLTRKRGLKLATTISVNHDSIQGKHDSTVSLTKRNLEASISTEGHVKLPHITLNLKHDLSGNTKSKPNVVSRVLLDYGLSFLSPDITTQGAVTHSLTMEGLTSYFNLETTTDARIEGSLSSQHKYTGAVYNEANAYLNSNGARANVKLRLKSLANTGSSKVWNITMNENLAVDASRKRIYALWEHAIDNAGKVLLLNGYGRQRSRATFELAPWSLTGNLQAEMQERDYLWGTISMQHQSTAVINSEIQKLNSNSKGIFEKYTIVSHDVQFLNSKEEVRLDIACFWQGSAYILKSFTLPVYQKSLYSILKMDQTNTGVHFQYLNVSTSIVMVKDENFLITLPVLITSDAVMILIPKLFSIDSEWVKSIPNVINGMLIQYLSDVPRIPEIADEINVPTFKIPGMNIVVPSYTFKLSEVRLPTVIITPTFKVPFTTLQVPSYTIDLTMITIPSKINTLPFDVTLPTLPAIRFPKVSIASKYLEVAEYKIPYFEVTVPEFRITILPFSLPKSFTIGDYYVELDKITNYVANFDLPTITIPEMTVEIPPLKFSLPAAIALPAFKSLTTNVKVSSPIYNTTWIASVGIALDQDTGIVFTAVLDATCTSTMQFLEYDLTGTVSANVTGENVNTIEKFTLKHRDFNVDWLERYQDEDLRSLYQANIDVKSPTFTDLHFHWLETDDKISGTISSPTTGLLGLIIELKESEVLHTKLYARKASSPTTDLVILDGKLSAENPKNIQVQVDWRNDVVVSMLEDLKKRVPKITRALYDCVNKYHNDHFGMDLSRASLKFKDSINGNINDAYRVAVNQVNELESQFQIAIDGVSLDYDQMKESIRKMYKRAEKNVDQSGIQRDIFGLIRIIIWDYYQIITNHIHSIVNFAKMTRFQPPGLDRPHTGQELYDMALNQSTKLEVLIQKVDNIVEGYLEAYIKYINQLELKLPSIDKVIKGSEILSELKEFLRKVQRYILKAVRNIKKSNFDNDIQSIKEYMKNCHDKMQSMLTELQYGDLETFKYQVHMVYLDIVDSPIGNVFDSGSVRFYVSELLQMSQTILTVLLEKIQAAGLYVKAIREEHPDDFLFGWTAMFIEMKEHVFQSLKELLDYIKEEGPKIVDEIVGYTDQVKQETRRFVEMSGDMVFNYLKDKLREFEGKANINITEYLRMLKAELNDLCLEAKSKMVEYKRMAKIKVQEAYDYFTASYDMLNLQARMAIHLIIQRYNQFMQTIYNFLEFISTLLSETTQPYMAVRPGQITLNLPHNF